MLKIFSALLITALFLAPTATFAHHNTGHTILCAIFPALPSCNPAPEPEPEPPIEEPIEEEEEESETPTPTPPVAAPAPSGGSMPWCSSRYAPGWNSTYPDGGCGGGIHIEPGEVLLTAGGVFDCPAWLKMGCVLPR